MISKKIQELKSDDLRAVAGKIAEHSRKIDALFIEHVAEIEKRKAYIEWGFSSLYDYLTDELKFSGAAAYRRIQAAYAFLQIPELKNEIESGALNLTQICSAQTAINREQKTVGPVTVAARREVFAELRNKNGRETEKILDLKFESGASSVPTEKHKHDDSVELNIRVPKDVYEKLARVREVYSHLVPDGNWIAIVEKMADDVLAKRDPLLKPSKIAQSRTAAETGGQGQKSLRSTVKRFIFQRDRVCQHRNPDGSVCGSRHQLEVDHIQPKFAGGSNQVENLRLLCRTHNAYRYQVGR